MVLGEFAFGLEWTFSISFFVDLLNYIVGPSVCSLKASIGDALLGVVEKALLWLFLILFIAQSTEVEGTQGTQNLATLFQFLPVFINTLQCSIN